MDQRLVDGRISRGGAFFWKGTRGSDNSNLPSL